MRGQPGVDGTGDAGVVVVVTTALTASQPQGDRQRHAGRMSHNQKR